MAVSLDQILAYIRKHAVINNSRSDDMGTEPAYPLAKEPPQINLIPSSTSYAGKVIITGLGPVVIGGGESAAKYNTLKNLSATNEATHITADTNVYVATGCQNWTDVDDSSLYRWQFTNEGTILDPDGDTIGGVKCPSEVRDETITLTTGTSWQSKKEMSIPAKTVCLIEIAVRFPTNANGYRGVNVSATAGGTRESHRFQDIRSAVTGGYTYCHLCFTYKNPDMAARTRYINLVQNSGTDMSDIIVAYRITTLSKLGA